MVADRWLSLDEHSLAADELLGHAADPDLTINTGRGLIIVCFTNRSGSTWICSQLSRLGLAGSPDRFNNYEFLNRPQFSEFTAAHGSMTFEAYLQEVISRRQGTAGQTTVKATPRQLNHLIEHGTWARFDRAPTVIWSYRRNVVRQAVSHWTAVQDGRWTSLHSPSGDRPDPVLRYETVMDIVRGLHRQNAEFSMIADCHSLPFIPLAYEDVEHSDRALLDTLERHLGTHGNRLADSLNPIQRQDSELKRQWEQDVRSRLAVDTRINAATVT